MNIVDIIFLGFLAFGFYFGYQKGIVHQLVGFLSLLISYIFAGSMSVFFKNYLISLGVISDKTSLLISFLLCSGLLFLGLKVLAYLVESVLKITFLNITNKFAGGIFGALKFLLISVIIVFLFEKINSASNLIPKETLATSYVYSGLQYIANVLISFVLN